MGHIQIIAMCSCHRVSLVHPLLFKPLCDEPGAREFGSCFELSFVLDLLKTQLSATDVSARTLMKGTAKCDKHCELQNSVNQQGFERILRFRDIPESMPASASLTFSYLVSFEVSLRIRYVREKHLCFCDYSSDAFSGYPTCCCDNTVKCAFCILSSVSVAVVGCSV